MPLSTMPTTDLRRQVARLLTELAERTHPGGVDQVRIQMCHAGHVAEVLTFRPDRVLAAAPDQAVWEGQTLDHWRALVPDMDSVTTVVRSYGRVVRTVVLEPAAGQSDRFRLPGEASAALSDNQ